MLSNGFDKPLHLKRKPSSLLMAYLLLIHGLALIALLQALAIPMLIHAMLYLSVLASFTYYLRSYRRHADGQEYWVWLAGGEWRYGGEEQAFRILPERCVQTPWFVLVMLVGFEKKRQRLLILRDQLDADSFRRLCVRLSLYHDEVTLSSEEVV